MPTFLFFIAVALLVLLALAGTLAIILYTTSSLTGARGNRAARPEVYRGDESTLAAACHRALQSSGASDIAQPGPGIVLVGRKRGSLWSSGEILTVRIAGPLDDGTCRVAVESRSAVPGTVLDWGQNRRNVAAFHACLAGELARSTKS